ncbi:MAG: response regulator transcription factor [Rickettsiales bacterium]|jgi:two-component system phosphate regulon response regulator OmpR|nr:response regulator transcription factor [Rickettsiales bacterium]
MPRVLVIDDDDKIRDLLSRYLASAGFYVESLPGAVGADASGFDLVVVDRMMPGVSGDEFVRRMREGGIGVPVVMLTAMGDAQSRISGLESGADDYMAKPFEPRELLLRINSILGRARGRPPGIHLTTLEKNIIEYMGARRGQSVSRDDLSRAFRLNDRGVDVAIARLRKKVGADAIETVRNVGYRLA